MAEQNFTFVSLVVNEVYRRLCHGDCYSQQIKNLLRGSQYIHMSPEALIRLILCYYRQHIKTFCHLLVIKIFV